jgi:tetratricopeptide (TPR) repeat protein
MERQLHTKHDQLEHLLHVAEEDESVLTELVSNYAHSVADRWDIAKPYHERIAKVAAKWSDGHNLAAAISKLSEILYYFYTTQFDKVGENADETIDLFLGHDEAELLGTSYMIKGVSLRSMGQFDEAIQNLSKATELIKKDGNFKIYYAFSQYQIAEIFVQLQDYDLAESHYQEADLIASLAEDVTAQFRMTNGMGNYYLVTKQWDKAISYLEKSPGH